MISYSMYKKLFILFKQFLYQIIKDAMLFICCLAPILCGVFIKFGIPFAENLLRLQLGYAEILAPYYLIFDLFLAVLTPMMFCFVASMIILGEIDDGISRYMAVTPLEKSGYLISRLGFPTIISFIITVIILYIFSLNDFSFEMMIGISILTSFIGLNISLMVVSISTNKVEGLAVVKLSGIFIIGIPAPFFITGNFQYPLYFLPSFWLSMFALENKIIFFFLCIGISIAWIFLLSKKFIKKIV